MVNSIKEGNKLIHEFLGFVRIKDTSNLTDDVSEIWYENNDFGEISQGVPPYHQDRNYLGLAIDKIGKVITAPNAPNIDTTQFDVFRFSLFAMVKDVWAAVIQFIEWYNEINKTKS